MSSKVVDKKNLVNLLILLMIAIFFEVFLFQIPFWKNIKNNPTDVPIDSIGVLSEGANLIDDKLSIDTKNTAVTIYIPLNGWENSIQIVCASEGKAFSHRFGTPHMITERELVETNILSVALYPEDMTGNMLSYEENFLMVNDNENNIFSIKKAEENSALCITFLQDEYMEPENPILLERIVLNPKCSFSFSFARFVCILGLMLGIYVLRPNSRLWNVKFSSVSWIQYILVVGIFLLFILWETMNPTWWNGRGFVDSYGELTRALANGHVALEYTPDPKLCDMNNPYDYYAREEIGVEYLFDYAFYQGKYYVYFGIVPSLVFLPYYMLTGKMISYVFVFNIMLGLFLLGLAKYLCGYEKRYFPSMSVAEFSLLLLLWVVLSFIPLLYFSGYNYIFPQIFAATFLMWGLYFYMEAGRKQGRCIKELLAGSLLFAMIAGCRPQQTIFALLAFPLLKEKMCKKGTGIQWIAFFAPYIMIAVPLMIYNKARFDSIFDFGAYYNLTNGNIYDAKVSIDSILKALRYYLLTGWEFTKDFPFIQIHSPNIEIPNVSVMDLTAGYLVSFPIAFLPIIYWPFRKKSKEMKELAIMQGILLLLSAVMGCVATFYLSHRYVFDFSPLLGLATVISYSLLLENKRYSSVKRSLILAIVVLGGIYLFLFGFTKKLDTLNIFYMNRDAWYKVSRLVQFWK